MVGSSMGLVKCRISTVLTLSAEPFVKSILLDPSYYLKHISKRNKIINRVKIFSTTGSSAALMTPKWHRPVEVRMKKPPGVKIIQLGQKHLPCWVVLEMGAGKVYDWSSCIFLFHVEVLNILTIFWENRFLLHKLSCWCANRTTHNDCGMH